MKKAILAVAALAACGSSAWAQSSVTLYGIVDAAVRYTSNNSGSQKQMIPGGMSQSRLGVNVTEDMGGGLKALVNLEHRLLSDTGNSGATNFWQQSWVGIQSNEFGQVRLGRQYNVLFDLYTSTYASFRYSPYIEAYKPEIGMSAAARQNNMVKYLGQAGNIYFEAQVSAGEGTGPTDKSIGGLVRYNDGSFAFGGGYLEVTDLGGKKAKNTTIGGSYTAGPLYVNLSWGQGKFQSGTVLGAAFTGGLLGAGVLNAVANDVKQRDMVMVGATYQLTPQLNLGAQYWHAEQKHFTPALANTKSKGDYFAVVADYAFSKRTDAYVEADITKHKGAVMFANGASKRGGAMVGLRHRF